MVEQIGTNLNKKYYAGDEVRAIFISECKKYVLRIDELEKRIEALENKKHNAKTKTYLNFTKYQEKYYKNDKMLSNISLSGVLCDMGLMVFEDRIGKDNKKNGKIYTTTDEGGKLNCFYLTGASFSIEDNQETADMLGAKIKGWLNESD